MIEINLIEQKKKLKAPVVLGIDLGKLPWGKLIISYLVATLPVGFIDDHFKSEIKKDEKEVNLLNQRYQKLRREVKANESIKAQLLAFNEQIEKLKSRSEQVDKIIKSKTNPRYVLEKIARSTPDNVWFEGLTINDSNEIEIEGGTDSYTSIGEFIVNLNDSPYFGRTLQLADSETKEETYNGNLFRVEKFSIKGRVDIYDPFTQGSN